MAIVYFYGGVAKLNADWLRGEPVRTWLTDRGETLGAWMANEAAVRFICYGGLLFDLLIVPLLLWRRTRLLAFVLAVGFHLTNRALFDIGVFPWLAIALTVLFFPPDTPRRIAARLHTLWSGRASLEQMRFPNLRQAGFTWRGSVGTFLILYLAWQLLMPLRHLLYPGNVSWTEEGHQFAWHMMLRSKEADALFVVRNADTGEAWAVDPLRWLTRRQYRKMAGRPDMLVQFAQHLARLMHQGGYPRVQVRAVVRVRFNGRPPALLIDPEVDLAKVQRGLGRAPWILGVGNDHPVPEWAKGVVGP
jgi:hypothetical protein